MPKTTDVISIKKQKTKDFPEALSKMTDVNSFRTAMKARFETDPNETGEVMVAYEVSLESSLQGGDNETFVLDDLSPWTSFGSYARMLAFNTSTNAPNSCAGRHFGS